jgi:hypothetical protein
MLKLEKVVHGAVGPSDLMEFTRFDLGEVLRKRNCAGAPRNMRFVVGNPIIMRQMVQQVPDADSYAPGNHSDRPASGWSLSLV